MGDAATSGAKTAATALAASAENDRFIFPLLENDVYSAENVIGLLGPPVTHSDTYY
jgi:hypothetical protein